MATSGGKMQVEMSLAELLMNAIANGRVRGVQFKRGWSKETETFEDLNVVIADRINNALSVAREAGHRRVREEWESGIKQRLLSRIAEVEAENKRLLTALDRRGP
jgi:hypothetical protein